MLIFSLLYGKNAKYKSYSLNQSVKTIIFTEYSVLQITLSIFLRLRIAFNGFPKKTQSGITWVIVIVLSKCLAMKISMQYKWKTVGVFSTE